MSDKTNDCKIITPYTASKWLELWNDPASSAKTKAVAVLAAPEMAQTIAGMTEQIGVQYKRNNGKWGMFRPCQSSSEAMNLLHEANGNARIAHRYVTTPEEVKP